MPSSEASSIVDELPPRRSRITKQPYRILVASAGDGSSIGAVHVAVTLARRKSASVHVLSVATPFPHVASTGLHVAPPALVDEDNRRGVIDSTRRQLGLVRGTKNWTLRAMVGWPVDCVLDAAARWPASLVIVGIGDHGVLDRLIGTETSLTLARRSTVPILAVPQSTRALPMRGVAAIDFTESSINAARIAATLLGPNGTLTLLHASTLVNQTSTPGSLTDVYTTGATDKLNEIRERVHRDTKRRVECAVVHGEVVDEIIGLVDTEQCDFIALGGHDQSFVDRLLLGSIRSRVLRKSPCPVLIAPHAHDAGTA
ncbi:MAG: universal stress protein [Gemmatimonadaceae bacterium]